MAGEHMGFEWRAERAGGGAQAGVAGEVGRRAVVLWVGVWECGCCVLCALGLWCSVFSVYGGVVVWYVLCALVLCGVVVWCYVLYAVVLCAVVLCGVVLWCCVLCAVMWCGVVWWCGAVCRA